MGNGGTTHYLLKGQWQTMYLRKSEKWKITFLSLIRLSCQTFMGQTENKGRGVRLLTQWSAAAVTGYRLGRVPKKNQALCLQELLISELPRGPFKRATDYVWPFFVCGFVCVWMLEPISITKKVHYKSFHCNTRFPLLEKGKFDTLPFTGCRQSSNAGVLLLINSGIYDFDIMMSIMSSYDCHKTLSL